MAKDFAVIELTSEMLRLYEEQDALDIARNEAERKPGRTFVAVQILATFEKGKSE